MLIGNLGEAILPVMIFAVPLVAIVGGITMGIVKTLSQSRLIENAQRERIAAIQAGIDPSKLPTIPHLDLNEMRDASLDPEGAQRRRTNGIMIGGIVTLFSGVGLALFLYIVDADGSSWAVGIVPAFIGIALLLSALLVRSRGGV